MKKYLIPLSAIVFCLTTTLHIFAQPSNPSDDWFLKSINAGVLGTGADEVYEALAGLKAEEVIVAVLDSGVEIDHEDLQNRLWTNADEIPDNGIDDDANGYVDDVHGWSFLGGPGGDVQYANLEFTRIYKSLRERFEGVKEVNVAAEDQADFQRYQTFKQQYQERVEKARAEADEYAKIDQFYAICKQALSQHFKGESYGLSDIQNMDANDDFMGAVKEFMVFALENDFESGLEEGRQHFNTLLNYAYNLDYDARAKIGDNPLDMDERDYGNNHYEGPDAGHGTHVAGIIGGDRSNTIGMKGISAHARIMVVRVVPDGDERDKDVANAIRYAADNGARIINMSFGKSYSPNKATVDAAMKYAEEKGVLLVHAAGNDGRNNDNSTNYPNDRYDGGSDVCSTWIEVGASTPEDNKYMLASFSNYGRRQVDIFAPGSEIYSSVPDGKYKRNQGTSMAAPMVSGAAAELMAYFPDLSAQQVKEILMESAYQRKRKRVVIPGEIKKKSKFKKLCVSGGVLNLAAAVEMAREVQP